MNKVFKQIGFTILLILIIAGSVHDAYLLFFQEYIEQVELDSDELVSNQYTGPELNLSEDEIVIRLQALNRLDLTPDELSELAVLLEYAEMKTGVVTPDESAAIREHIDNLKQN
jgi:hypothetical protein